jgi:hypothetical protein
VLYQRRVACRVIYQADFGAEISGIPSHASQGAGMIGILRGQDSLVSLDPQRTAKLVGLPRRVGTIALTNSSDGVQQRPCQPAAQQFAQLIFQAEQQAQPR